MRDTQYNETKIDQFSGIKPVKKKSPPGPLYITHQETEHQVVSNNIQDVDNALNNIGENLIKIRDSIQNLDDRQKELLKKEYEYFSKMILPFL